MNQPPDHIKEKMLLFFLRTSAPRIMEQRRIEEKNNKEKDGRKEVCKN